MIVSHSRFINGIKRYISDEIASRMTGINKFAIYFILPSLDSKIEEYLKTYSTNPMFVDFFTDKGIDIDALRTRTISALNHCDDKLRLRFLDNDICIGTDDVDIVYRFIKEEK